MSGDIPLDIIRRHNEFAKEFCSSLGLPPPKPWTEEDEARFQAKEAEVDRQIDAYRARLRKEAA